MSEIDRLLKELGELYAELYAELDSAFPMKNSDRTQVLTHPRPSSHGPDIPRSTLSQAIAAVTRSLHNGPSRPSPG